MILSPKEKEELVRSIKIDPYLSVDDRQKIVNAIEHENNYYKELFGGAMGATIGYSISKFLKLAKTSQVILTVAGFGIGKYLIDNSHNSDKFMEYNKKLKGYKLNT